MAPGKKGEAKATTHTDPYKQGATLGIGLYSRFQRARLLDRVHSFAEFKLKPKRFLQVRISRNLLFCSTYSIFLTQPLEDEASLKVISYFYIVPGVSLTGPVGGVDT